MEKLIGIIRFGTGHPGGEDLAVKRYLRRLCEVGLLESEGSTSNKTYKRVANRAILCVIKIKLSKMTDSL